MKTIFMPALLIICFSNAKSQTYTFTDAVSYNDFIVNQQDNIGFDMQMYQDELADTSTTYDDVEYSRQYLLGTISEEIDSLNQLAPYDGSTVLRDRAMDLFNFYQAIVTNEYKQIQDLYFSDNYSTDTQNQIVQIAADIANREATYDDALQSAQKLFADKYGFTLIYSNTDSTGTDSTYDDDEDW